MTRIGRRLSFSLRSGPGLAASVLCGLTLGLTWPSAVEASKLTRFLTREDIAGRMLLDQNGERIQVPTAADRHPALSTGSIPTYLAIPLNGGEHLPASIPTLVTGPQEGENPVGPLNFDAIVKANLDQTLHTSKLATVDTPAHNYLVEFLPGRAHSGSTLEKATRAATTTVSELTDLLKTGSNQLTKLSQTGMNKLENFLHIKSSKHSAAGPSLNLEAQVLGGANVLPAAIPEPSTWMVFAGLVVGGALLRRRQWQPASSI